MNKLTAIENAFAALLEGKKNEAVAVLREGYPFEPTGKNSRRYTPAQSMRTFLRDGFIDRYSGERLLYPGVLRVLSLELPDNVPYQSHWKVSETHMVYWHYHPTVDHILPIARGGNDSESNLATTSQLRNSAKSHWLLEELGWKLHPPGSLKVWDGFLQHTKKYVAKNPQLLDDAVMKKWHKAVTEIEKIEQDH